MHRRFVRRDQVSGLITYQASLFSADAAVWAVGFAELVRPHRRRSTTPIYRPILSGDRGIPCDQYPERFRKGDLFVRNDQVSGYIIYSAKRMYSPVSQVFDA